jgi:hypothetical protein
MTTKGPFLLLHIEGLWKNLLEDCLACARLICAHYSDRARILVYSFIEWALLVLDQHSLQFHRFLKMLAAPKPMLYVESMLGDSFNYVDERIGWSRKGAPSRSRAAGDDLKQSNDSDAVMHKVRKLCVGATGAAIYAEIALLSL